jgi:hypothetical protein
MGYTITDIESIFSTESMTSQEKIDELLRIDCSMYASLGTDSDESDRSNVKAISNRIYRLINDLDSEVGSLLMINTDSE